MHALHLGCRSSPGGVLHIERTGLVRDIHSSGRGEGFFECTASSFLARNLFPFGRRHEQVLRALYENPHEPTFFQIYAAFLLGVQYTGGQRLYFDLPAGGHEAFVQQCLTGAIEGCRSPVARTSRSILVPKNGNGHVSVGDIYDKIERAALRRMDHVTNPEATLKLQEEAFAHQLSHSIHHGPLSQPKVAKELWRSMQKVRQLHMDDESDPVACFFRAPTVTTNVLKGVKHLPQVDNIFLIVEKGNVVDDLLREYYPDKAKTLELYTRFAILEVRSEPLGSGKARKSKSPRRVFRKMQSVFCHTGETRQKNIVGSLVVACQDPFRDTRASPLTAPPQPLPRRILLPQRQDVNDPQLQLFFAMMGCTEIDEADPDLLNLWEATKEGGDAALEKGDKANSPHLYDLSRGNKCGNCEKVGPRLKKCSCGGTYYCNVDCQTAQWKHHKNEHKARPKRK